MGKDHPEVKELKNICETSKKPKRVYDVVNKEKRKKPLRSKS